jgi:hypothetical protein
MISWPAYNWSRAGGWNTMIRVLFNDAVSSSDYNSTQPIAGLPSIRPAGRIRHAVHFYSNSERD